MFSSRSANGEESVELCGAVDLQSVRIAFFEGLTLAGACFVALWQRIAPTVERGHIWNCFGNDSPR